MIDLYGSTEPIEVGCTGSYPLFFPRRSRSVLGLDRRNTDDAEEISSLVFVPNALERKRRRELVPLVSWSGGATTEAGEEAGEDSFLGSAVGRKSWPLVAAPLQA